jgi:hypothetical protein
MNFGLTNGTRIVQQLALQIVRFYSVHIRNSQGTDASCGEVECGWTPEPSCSDDENACGCELLLTFHADLAQQDMARVP